MASNMFWLSLEAAPSAPSATLTPPSSRSATGRIPDPHRRFDTGLCTMVAPQRLTVEYSSGSIHTQWARLEPGYSSPRSSRYDTLDRP